MVDEEFLDAVIAACALRYARSKGARPMVDRDEFKSDLECLLATLLTPIEIRDQEKRVSAEIFAPVTQRAAAIARSCDELLKLLNESNNIDNYYTPVFLRNARLLPSWEKLKRGIKQTAETAKSIAGAKLATIELLMSDTDSFVSHAAYVFAKHIGKAGEREDGVFARFCIEVCRRAGRPIRGSSVKKSLHQLRKKDPNVGKVAPEF